MATKKMSVGALLATALLFSGFSGCGDESEIVGFHREKMLSVKPIQGFIPQTGLPAEIEYSEMKDATNPQGSYLEGTYVAAVPASNVHVRLVAKNESDMDIPLMLLTVYIQDPNKVALFNVADWAFFGGDRFNKPTPAMLDTENTLFENDPYDGFVTYIPVKPMAAGESFEFEVVMGSAEGAKMHIEAVGMFKDENGETTDFWGVPVANSGTTILVTQEASASSAASRELPRELIDELEAMTKQQPSSSVEQSARIFAPALAK